MKKVVVIAPAATASTTAPAAIIFGDIAFRPVATATVAVAGIIAAGMVGFAMGAVIDTVWPVTATLVTFVGTVIATATVVSGIVARAVIGTATRQSG